MFVRVLTVHCDQNNSYEITINGFQVRKINEIRNVIFGLRYGKPSSALRPKLRCSPSWVLDEIQIFLGKPCLNNKDSWPKLIKRKIRKQSKNSFLLVIRLVYLTMLLPKFMAFPAYIREFLPPTIRWLSLVVICWNNL